MIKLTKLIKHSNLTVRAFANAPNKPMVSKSTNPASKDSE